MNLSWPGSEDWCYLLGTSTDLADWREFVAPIAGQATPIQWQEPMNGPRKFYRILDGIQSKAPGL